MIDDKKLDLFERDVQDGCDIEGTTEELMELIRLARLGLWAKEHGIPMIERARRYELTPNDPEQALAALPQEMKEKK